MRNRSCLFLFITIFLLSTPSFLYAASVQLSWQSNPESDLQSYNVYYGTQTRSYGPPIPVENGTSFTLSGLDEGATYFFAVSAVDTSGNESGYSEEVTKSIPFTDNPYQLLWSPNDRSNPTSLDNATISGDGYIFLSPETSVVQVDYSIDGQSHNTERYAPFDIGEPVHTTDMTDGTHVISTRVILGNGSTLDFDTICTVSNPQVPPSDTTAPEIRITAPTSGSSYTSQNATIGLSGTAVDNQGLQQITWTSSNNTSGTASGTSSWSVSDIQLAEGQNVITVTATDTAGNHASDTITVTCIAPDTQAPTIAITAPTDSGTFTSESAKVDIAGTAGDDRELDRITWTASNGLDGTASGTTSWSVSGINLAEGDTIITVTAIDKAGNTESKTLTIHYSAQDAEAPAVKIISPTTKSSFFSRASSITVGGTATDNAGIAKVVWRNSRGESGICNGINNWQASEISLDRWWNTITVTAFDYAGNSSQQELRVFRWR